MITKIIVIFCSIALIITAVLFLAYPYQVSGNALYPFFPNQFVLTESVSLNFKEPQVGDRIIFAPTGRTSSFIGNIVGVNMTGADKIYEVQSTAYGSLWKISKAEIKRRIYFPFK